MAFLTNDAGAVFDAAEVESIWVASYATSSSVYVRSNGADHRMAIFRAKKMVDKYPELAGMSGADLPDPKSLKKAAKKAEALKARLIDVLDIDVLEV